MAFNGNGGNRGGKTPYKHKADHGTMFDNDRKTKETQPDFTGSIDVNGTVYWISGWKGKTQAGKRKLSLALTRQDERRPDQGGGRQQPQRGGDDW